MNSTSNKQHLTLPSGVVIFNGDNYQIDITEIKKNSAYAGSDLVVIVETSDHACQARREAESLLTCPDSLKIDVTEMNLVHSSTDKLIYLRLVRAGKTSVHTEYEYRHEIGEKSTSKKRKSRKSKPTSDVPPVTLPFSKSLLRTTYKPLGELVYEVDYDDLGPILIFNDKLERGVWPRMPYFSSTTLPTIVREILTRLLITEGYTNVSWDTKEKWADLARLYSGSALPDEDAATNVEKAAWIKNCTSKFADKQEAASKFKSWLAAS